ADGPDDSLGRDDLGMPRSDLSARPSTLAGRSPAYYAALAEAGARRLDRCAEQLAACARQSGWNHDSFGEACRMTLLEHAKRCARAAADTRKAAEWLAR
ncbi:hypothetical protein, partial [Streptomyces sp. N35]|uniref:hypothetical protein n=1 Tax=Streptomyces sp. N35 TaxID=2795730 RepID=UPI001F2300A3